MTAFARVTAIHDFLSILMTPCAGQLYRWLLRRVPAGVVQELFLQDFADWSAEARGKPYSIRHIQRALQELIDNGIIEVLTRYTGKIFKVICTHPDPSKQSDKKVSKLDQNLQNGTQMSKTRPSKSDSAVPINREYLETTDTPTHNHPVPVQEFDNEGTSSASRSAIADGQHKVTEGISEPHKISTCDAPKIPKNGTIFSEEIKIAPEDSVPDPPVPAPCELETPAPAPVRRGGIDPQLRREVEAAIAPAPLNANLRKVIEEAEPQVVRDAISVLQENRDRGQVRRPAGMLTMAIRGRWVPNEETSMIPEGFSEWFDLARHKGIVAASTVIAGQMMVCIDLAEAKWKPWTEISAVFTMSYLQRMHPIKGT